MLKLGTPLIFLEAALCILVVLGVVRGLKTRPLPVLKAVSLGAFFALAVVAPALLIISLKTASVDELMNSVLLQQAASCLAVSCLAFDRRSRLSLWLSGACVVVAAVFLVLSLARD
jgi:Ca2+/Na+ antiporter